MQAGSGKRYDVLSVAPAVAGSGAERPDRESTARFNSSSARPAN